MPWITVNLMDTHTEDEKRELFKTLTESTAKSLNLPEEYVRIQLVEMNEINHSIAGKSIKDMNKCQ